jgi:hypothetical protein
MSRRIVEPVKIIPGRKDDRGFYLSARSGCCRSLLAMFHPDIQKYVHWDGLGEVLGDLRCNLCNRSARL